MAIDPNDPEYQASKLVPTTHVNRAYVTVNGPWVRIAMGEGANAEDSTAYHSAVMLSKADARELAHIILRLAAPEAPPPAPLPFSSNALSGIGGPPSVRRP